ncbi:putative carboxymethylenebutenolidase [Gigantopelta aegis]|uniref:putative carboxymethylenebutenolidase n=1 Tax=Gigantopelta aegis TaxID=1735272 RepID=UPI001B88E138|nr:putative carboxymethylenebutenolidase [Gigantopelta aegis]
MGEHIKVSSENEKGDVPCVLFKGGAGSPAIIVLQEWWGVNQHILDLAQEISNKSGFTTIVPDLYRGHVAINREDAGHLMTGLDWPGAVKDIQGCARYLLKHGHTKVGSTGFCMGGALTVAACCLAPEVNAGVVFYGVPKPELCDPSTIKVPIQCHFGDKDDIVGFSAPVDAKRLKDQLEAGKVQYEFHGYDVGHAFVNSSGPYYDKEACDLSMERMYAFFEKHLK